MIPPIYRTSSPPEMVSNLMAASEQRGKLNIKYGRQLNIYW